MKKIVLGFDSSAEAVDALRLAEGLRAVDDGELIVVSVEELEPVFADLPTWQEQADAKRASDFAQVESTLGRKDFTRRAEIGSVPRALDLIAEAEDADVIVVGSTHRGAIGRVLPGSVGDRLLSGAPCAVAIAPVGYANREHPAISRVGVAYDGEAESLAALHAAAALARRLDAELSVIAVVPTLTDEMLSGRIGHTKAGYIAMLHERFKTLIADALAEVPSEMQARSVLLEGDPAEQIAAQGVELDLLVIGSRGYGPIRRTLLGGVASEVITLAPCPVIVLPRSAGDPGSPSESDRDGSAAAA